MPTSLHKIFGSRELAHYALGHTRYFRAQISRMFRWLSRLDELTCDAVANELTDDRAASAMALMVMFTGPQLLPYVNHAQLAVQARQVVLDKTRKKAERQLTHPLLLRRLHRFVS